jgi:hypothetical protein
MKQKTLFIFAMLFYVLYSCTTVKVVSNKAGNYHQKLSKVFVLIKSEVKAAKFSNTFATKLMSAFKEHHIQGEFTQRHSLSLETDAEYLEKVKKFAPKQLMTIKQTAINLRAPSIINTIVFEIQILDSKTNKIIWKGELDIYGQVGLEDTIDKSLKRLIKKLTKDELI